jgi:putative transposase
MRWSEVWSAMMCRTFYVHMTCILPGVFCDRVYFALVLLRRAERYRLYPTPEQVERLHAWEGALRWLWNHWHTERVAKLEEGCKLPTTFDQINDLAALRGGLEWLADVPRNVCAQLAVELDKAWQRGFKKLSRMPRYKSKQRGDRAPLIEPHKKLFRVEGEFKDGTVTFPKLGVGGWALGSETG